MGFTPFFVHPPCIPVRGVAVVLEKFHKKY